MIAQNLLIISPLQNQFNTLYPWSLLSEGIYIRITHLITKNVNNILLTFTIFLKT